MKPDSSGCCSLLLMFEFQLDLFMTAKLPFFCLLIRRHNPKKAVFIYINHLSD